MISAFGVDHGYEEIEKLSFGGIGTGLGRGVFGAGQGIARRGAGLMRSSRPGAGKRMAGPGKTNRPMSAIGQAGVNVGGGLRRLGARMQANPGMTGKIAVGGAAGAGTLGTGAAVMNRRRFG